jgi:hypothetical protein
MAATKPAGTKLPQATYESLRWLAYKRHTTVSALIASYVEAGLQIETRLGELSDAPMKRDGQA